MGERIPHSRKYHRTALRLALSSVLLASVNFLDVQTAHAEQPGNKLTQSTERNPDLKPFIPDPRGPRTIVLNGTMLSLVEAAGAILQSPSKSR